METGHYFYISGPVVDLKMLSPVFDRMVISLLYIREPQITEISYDFSSPYVGWMYSVLPFISFLFGLSSISKEVICGRIVHLSQSSGHGKTRLCFEALKFLRSGVYTVYRSGSPGHPNTTPWMERLISNFSTSTSNDRSIYVCAKFIQAALKNFIV